MNLESITERNKDEKPNRRQAGQCFYTVSLCITLEAYLHMQPFKVDTNKSAELMCIQVTSRK